MKKVRITAMRVARYDDLIAQYENPIAHACSMREGAVFIANGWQRPEGFCESAWETLSPFVMALVHGAEDFYDGWMKNPRSAMLSCNDGFRPVSFLLEALDDDAESNGGDPMNPIQETNRAARAEATDRPDGLDGGVRTAPYTIRRFEATDAEAVSGVIIHTLRVSNVGDYSEADMEALALRQQPADVLARAGWTHFYVAEAGGGIVGCGAIGPYWGSETESSLFSIFVLPEWQGRGVGRAIVEALERDEYGVRAGRIEVPASITGLEFYRKLGYDYKNGIARLDEERLYRLEKFPRHGVT